MVHLRKTRAELLKIDKHFVRSLSLTNSKKNKYWIVKVTVNQNTQYFFHCYYGHTLLKVCVLLLHLARILEYA